MTPECWEQLEQLYHQARERTAADRARFLDEACAGDAELHREIASLLAHGEAEDFPVSRPDDVVAAMVADQQATAMIGRTLGHYQIESFLGEGGMGQVYRARDARLGRDVAVKLLPDHLARDAEALRRFEREAQAVAALSHPNILSIFDFGNEQGVTYAVMQLLEGETLRDRLKRGPIAWREAVDVGLAIAEGLAATHAKGIIHRDLKPENIFLTDSGSVKILDFGIARIQRPVLPDADTLTSPASELTRAGQTPGTPGYMSPEQLRGERADAPSDLFSLGCVLYEMLSGTRPFAHRSFAETLAATMKDEPPPLRQQARKIPAQLEQIIRKAMRKDRADRHQSAEELLRELKQLKRDDRPPRWPRARARAGLALGIAMLALGGIGYQQCRPSPPGGPPPAPPPREVMRYYLEIESQRGEIKRTTGAEPLEVGDQSTFRFHFQPRDRGYLYILAPSQDAVPTTFLTAQPDVNTGVRTNFVEAGADFGFPGGTDQALALDQLPNNTLFTIIYSPKPLETPKFLTTRSYQPLAAAEANELDSLWQVFGKQAPELIPQLDVNQPSVAVVVPADRPPDHPLLFEILLRRR